MLLHVANGRTQELRILARVPEDMEGKTLGALGSDAGQLLQLLDEPGKRFGEGQG